MSKASHGSTRIGREVCASLMAPLPDASHGDVWMQAMQAIDAAELAQVTRCGKASLAQVSSRLQQWKNSGNPTDKPWAEVLGECCHAFMERCAEIVEMSSATPKLSSNLLGAAVHLAELVGKTGLVLSAMDSDMTNLADRVSKLELIYDVAVKRVESVASEIARGIDASTHEKAKQREAEMQSINEDLRKTLVESQQRCIAAEERATDLLRQLSALPQTRSRNSSYGSHDFDRKALNDARRLQSSELTAPHWSPLKRTSQPPRTQALRSQDPLELSVYAALDHLKALLEQAQDAHPSLQPLLPLITGVDTVPTSQSLRSAASTAISWADSCLSFRDPILAASVKQSASHLQCLGDLLNT